MTTATTKIEKLPRNWVRIRLGELINLKYGKSLTKKSRNENGKFPVFGSSGIVGYHDQYLIKAPVLIVGRKGAVGEVSFSDKNCWAIDTTYFVKLPDKLSIKFFFYLLKLSTRQNLPYIEM